MGNVMCCCKGREKNLEEGKAEDVGIPSINSKNTITKVKGKNTVTITPADDSTFSEHRELGPPSSSNDRNSNNNKICMANFNTFGGDNFVPEEDEFKPSKSSNSAKPGKNSMMQSLNSLDPMTSMSTETSKSIKSKFYLRISIDNLDILYKLCEDFGLVFKPYLEISIENQESIKVYPQQGDDLDKSLNSTNLSDTSMNNLNISQNRAGTNNSFLIGKERSYSFKFTRSFEISMRDLHTNIKIFVKNDVPGKISNNALPVIAIGECKIPVNLLYKYYNESSFEGNVEIKLRGATFIGYVKVLLTVSDTILSPQDEFMDKMQKAKFFDEDEDVKYTDNMSGHSVSAKYMNIWDKNFLNFDELEPMILDKYFLINSENKEQIFSLSRTISQSYPKSNSNTTISFPDYKDLHKYFLEACKNENLLALYQILVLFVRITNKDEFKLVSEFFKLLTDNDKSNLIEFCKNCNNNPYIIKLYLIFFYNYIRYFKNNKSITIRNNKDIDEQEIIKNIIEILGSLNGLKLSTLNSWIQDEIRECILWALNLLNELIAEPVELDIKLNKEEMLEHKKKEYTLVYHNCILMVYKRMSILRLIDTYSIDSQIIGGIFRIFRKVIKVLTNDTCSLLDLTKINIHPREFSVKFRVNIF